MENLRNEYPRPTLVRENWTNLNGKWHFEIDDAKVGGEKEFYNRESLDGEIIVPFCPESKLSGVCHTDFMNCVWYKKKISIKKNGKRIILHFGAVDYFAKVYVNGTLAGSHKGGYTPFSFDITELVKDGENDITLCAEDDLRSRTQPCGKQSGKLKSHGCSYTRTTGIWQTVWLEEVSECYIKDIKITSDISVPLINLGVTLSEMPANTYVTATALWDGKVVGERKVEVFAKQLNFGIDLSEKHLWELGKGGLYSLKLTVETDNNVCDEVSSYFGLRSVSLDGRKFRINGKSVFGRWVLDQGFYPDGVYTAPTDEDLKRDIEYSMQLGFNGARLHEKIFEPRFLYWADVLGYMVWGEHANWGLDITTEGRVDAFLNEWVESVKRDFNHPSIIGWCPFNETTGTAGRPSDNEIIRTVYKTTKALDPTRPVIDSSGWVHVETDIFDVHDYEQDAEKFAQSYKNLVAEEMKDAASFLAPGRQKYDGKAPIFVSEYGGIHWSNDENSWGYGDAPKTEEEFIERYKALTDVLLDNPNMLGFCYTQLYDVEQEQNGLMTYEREFKFDPDIFKKINSRKAAIED